MHETNFDLSNTGGKLTMFCVVRGASLSSNVKGR